MRSEMVEREFAEEEEDAMTETIDDIEMREKNKKLDQKEKERKEKMREERLKRMQAFQAAALLREEPVDEEDDSEDEKVEEQEPEDNPFYSSYNDAVEKNMELDDPMKEVSLPLFSDQTGKCVLTRFQSPHDRWSIH